MTLNFPAVEDVPLEKSPLREVICQVRFPTILSIARDQPVDFQNVVRRRFPELTEEQSVQIRVSGGPSAQADATSRVFHFHSAKEDAQVSLAVDAYALSTTSYRVWGEFAQDIALVQEAAITAYNIPYAKRIGLRYINQLDSESTGCGTLQEIREFLRPELSSLMITDAWDRPEELVSQILLDDEGRHMILRVAARVPNGESPVLLLDIDYYEESQAIQLDDLLVKFAQFHDVIYRAFRWSIRPDRLSHFAPSFGD